MHFHMRFNYSVPKKLFTHAVPTLDYVLCNKYMTVKFYIRYVHQVIHTYKSLGTYVHQIPLE